MRLIISVVLVLAAIVCVPGVASAFHSPVVANPGFEDGNAENGAPGWGWYNRATASFRASTDNPHSGRQCLVLSNNSDLAPEVYGRLHQGVGVLPNTEYRLTVWVRGENVTPGNHFTDWSSYMLDVPTGNYGWTEISTQFRTNDGQGGLNLGLNITNKCTELAIDDISLTPVGLTLDAEGITGEFYLPGQIIGDNVSSSVRIALDNTRTDPVRIRVKIEAERTVLLDENERCNKGNNVFEWKFDSGTTTRRQLTCSVDLLDLDGTIIGTRSAIIQKISPRTLLRDLEEIERRFDQFNDLYDQCADQNIPLDYPRVAKIMLEQFIPLAREDALKGEERRADFAIKDFKRTLDEGITTLRQYLDRSDSAPVAQRYQTGPLEIRDLSFIGNRADSLGNASHGPLFFCGMGHFYQVRQDMEKWPGYGVNIIQIEIGPSVTLPEEGVVDLKAAMAVMKTLDQAAENNVKVNILLSPHYFPKWAMQKWPHLGSAGGGFIGYCIYAEESKAVIEEFLRTVVPLFKDHPALHSFCLSNEPIYNGFAECGGTGSEWTKHLVNTHGDIHTLNKRYGTNHDSFESILMSGDYNAPQFYDYVIFNQERFAGWHSWMADVIHEMAPQVPVHAKIMWLSAQSRPAIVWGVDPELFGEFSQINGNDCSIQPGNETSGISWFPQNFFYDLQRSVACKPIFNSENHLQPDGSTSYVKPEHYITALWQGAIHGQGATTIWVWERTKAKDAPDYAATVPFYGNVMDRPGCAQAVGVTCLELNRFAEEVTVLQHVRAPMAIFYSMASYAKEPAFLPIISQVYSALNFSGVKVDFITEKQIASGKGENYRAIILPGTTHVGEGALEGLRQLPSDVTLIGVGDTIQRNPYGVPYPEERLEPVRARCQTLPGDATGETLLPVIRSELEKVSWLPPIQVLDATSGEPAEGVEWLPARLENRVVINMVNLTAKPKEVKILLEGKETEGTVLTNFGRPKSTTPEANGTTIRLEPITPVLAELRCVEN